MLAALVAIAQVALIASWVRSLTRHDLLTYRTVDVAEPIDAGGRATTLQFSVHDGSIVAGVQRVEYLDRGDAEAARQGQPGARWSALPTGVCCGLGFYPAYNVPSLLGVGGRWETIASPRTQITMAHVAAPHWFLFALLGVPAVRIAWQAWRERVARSRRERGLCVRCAYDLRGGDEAAPCPECGSAEVAAPAAPA